jgi:hypothetical protein
MTPDEIKSKLRELLGRDPEVERTANGQYFVVYFNWSSQGVRPLHASEEDALRELYLHLTAQTAPSA